MLGLYKPAGLLVQADQTGELSLLELAKDWLKERYRKPGQVFLALVHRLDRPVAGVILYGRTSKAAQRLSEQFRTGTVQKQYLAILHGRLKEPSGRLIHFIERRPERSSRILPKATDQTQEARLTYRVLDTFRSKSLVEIQLETGRHHQIRIQMAHIGHPVVGDLRYGAPAPLPQKQIALMAKKLLIVHPTLKEEISIESPLPFGWPWPHEAGSPEAPPWNWVELIPLIFH
ncbi:RNA pseudouridine synthase [Desulforhabdus amnigena]|uniref:RNA pseudouridine synthase n=1 Tax=Desulforhabdus amnigena TaxID=40218 RepID=A0A9W6FRC6_9BACT|nr:RNA pseudouridine synthase [Desulforhabdus amnigena]